MIKVSFVALLIPNRDLSFKNLKDFSPMLFRILFFSLPMHRLLRNHYPKHRRHRETKTKKSKTCLPNWKHDKIENMGNKQWFGEKLCIYCMLSLGSMQFFLFKFLYLHTNRFCALKENIKLEVLRVWAELARPVHWNQGLYIFPVQRQNQLV